MQAEAVAPLPGAEVQGASTGDLSDIKSTGAAVSIGEGPKDGSDVGKPEPRRSGPRVFVTGTHVLVESWHEGVGSARAGGPLVRRRSSAKSSGARATKCLPRGKTEAIDYADLLDFRDYERLLQLRADARVQYDPDDASHVRRLLLLWKGAFPNLALAGKVSTQWKMLGFQGADPATDFRGGGLLSLDCMLWLSREREAVFRKLIESRSAIAPGFALVVINVVHMLKFVLRLEDGVNAFGHQPLRARELRKWAHIFAAYECSFKALVASCVEVAYHVWELFVARQTSATVMDFTPAVLKGMPQDLSRALAKCKASATLGDLHGMLLRVATSRKRKSRPHR